MSMRSIKKGSTDQSVVIRIIDSTDGTPETSVVYNTSGIDLWYRREGATKTSITEATLTNLNDAHSDGGVLHIGDGYYRLDLPDAAVSSSAGVNGVMVGGTVTGMIVIGCYVPLVDHDPYDGVRLGLTALPNAAADAAGGLPISDAGGLDLDAKIGALTFTVAGDVDVNIQSIAGAALNTSSAQIGVNVVNAAGTAWGSGAITAAAIATGAIDADAIADNAIDAGAIATGAITNAKFAAGAIDAAAIADNAIDAGAIATGAITNAKFAAGAIDAAAVANAAIDAATFAADVDAKIATMVWNAATASYGGAGTYGQAMEDALADTNELQGDITNGGRVDLLVDAIKAKTDLIPAAPAATGDIPSAATIADAVWDEASTGHTDAGKAGQQLWTDVDAILADTGELQTNQGNWLTATGFSTHSAADVWSATNATLSLTYAVITERLYRFLMNKMNITDATGAVALRNEADGADLATQSITDNDTTTVRTALTWA